MTDVKLLNQVKSFLVDHYNPDTANLVQSRWKKTAIKISMVPILDVYYRHLVDHLDEPAYQTFQALRSDFSKYVQLKIDGKAETEKDDIEFLVAMVAKHHLDMAMDIVHKDLQSSSLPDTVKASLITAIEKQDFVRLKELVNPSDTFKNW